MAITRAQQVKQMLQDGGRIGYRGGADMGAVGKEKNISGAIGSSSNEKISASDARDTNMDRAREIGRANQTLKLLAEDKAQEPFETLIIKDSGIPGIGGTILDALKGPRQFMLNKNVDYFKGLKSRGRLNDPRYTANAQGYKNYMADRQAGLIDAAGNPIMGGDDDKNMFLPVDTTFAQAPGDTDQGTEDQDEDLKLAFRANGGRIGFRIGSDSGKDTSGRDYGASTAAAASVASSPSSNTGGGDNNQQTVTAPVNIPKPVKDAINLGGDISYLKNLIELNPVGIMKNIGGKLIMDKVIGDQTSLDTENKNMMLAGLTEKQKQLLDERKGMRDALGDDFLLDTIKQNDDPNDPATLEDVQTYLGADGGRVAAMDGGMMSPEGGIMDLETGRQMYGLGKLVKKVTRTVKKIAKSPIGKAALLYAGGAGLAGLGTGTSFMSNLMSPTSLFRNLAMSGKGFLTGISGGALQFPGAAVASNAPGAFKLGEFLRTPKGILTGITAASTVAGALTAAQEQEAQSLADNTGIDIEEARNQILKAAAGQDDFRARAFKADGGIMRAGYQEGSKEPVAKKTMPLLDMSGKEMDLREDGGFVPIGRMEKADDVPARLSKNEFVFTADAVRNAGDGNVDKGAEVMYNMMKNLESGGDVSEESQGLEGARRMFQTSQRLEEVL